jgi:RNA binding exosome subunit
VVKMTSKRGKGKQPALKEAIISSISHSTEDLEKVKESMLKLLPTDIREKYSERFTLRVFRGFHGNEIRLLQVNINGKDAVTLIENILCNLRRSSIDILVNTLNERIDHSGNLYLRLGKQEAFKGSMEIYEGDDTVRIVFKPWYNKEGFWEDFIKTQTGKRCMN